MKKIRIIALVLLIIGVGLLITIIGRRNKDYSNIITSSINEYLSKDNINELEEIKKLLDSFYYDKKERAEINNLVYKEVGERMLLIDNLYTCDIDNKIDCDIEIEEFKRYNEQIKKLHEVKSKRGYILLQDNNYNNIDEEITRKINGLDLIKNTN